MVNSSKRFFFDDRFSDDSRLPKILNATLEHDLYNFNIIGEKTIVEDEIQGRDEPYLYDVDLKPLEFKMTIAFENYETIDEVTKVIKWLYNPKTYKRLSFDDMENNFFVIFIGSPEYYYVGNNNVGFNKYIGYITCTVRANAPYGYTDILTDTNNTGDLEVYPSFSIQNVETNLGFNPFNRKSLQFIIPDPIPDTLEIKMPLTTYEKGSIKIYQGAFLNTSSFLITGQPAFSGSAFINPRFNEETKILTLSNEDLTTLEVGTHTISFRDNHIFPVTLSLLEVLKYSSTGAPGAGSFPENEWETIDIQIDSKKTNPFLLINTNIDTRVYHIGDLYTDSNTGKLYRYGYAGVVNNPTNINAHKTLHLNTNENSGYFWQEIQDINQKELALSQATEATEEDDLEPPNIKEDGSSFTYLLSVGETIEFNGYTKVLTSSIVGKNPYAAWGKDYLTFQPGYHKILVSSSELIAGVIVWPHVFQPRIYQSLGYVEFSYRAPKYL